jgi:DNA-binding transcriptional LysR family regulator
MAKPLRAPDIIELRAFCLAADLGGIGRAAVALRTSQPAVSKRLRSLEAIAGAKLLERSSAGVKLTTAGKRLYPEARRLLDQADAITDLLGTLGATKETLRIAVSHTVGEYHLAPELVAYQTRPGVQRPLELTAANSQAVRRMVVDGRAEIGIVANRLPDDPEDHLEELELLDDEIVLAVPESHPWYRRETIGRDEFLRTPLIVRDPGAHGRRLVDAVLASFRERLATPRLEVGSSAAAKREALELGTPILLSALALDERLDRLYRRPIEGLRFRRRFLVVCRSSSDLRASERDLIEFLRRRRLTVVPSPQPTADT